MGYPLLSRPVWGTPTSDLGWGTTHHLTCTLHENFVLDVTSLMSQSQMMKICKIFPLYTFQMSSHVDVRWHLKSYLASTLRENFGVLELTLGHVRWMQGEIWKVTSCAPWWSWHLVMLDGCEVKFEKSSCMHHAWKLWWWRGHLVMLDVCEVRFEKSSCVHHAW